MILGGSDLIRDSKVTGFLLERDMKGKGGVCGAESPLLGLKMKPCGKERGFRELKATSS